MLMGYQISAAAEAKLASIEARTDAGGALSPRLHQSQRGQRGRRMDPETPPPEIDPDGADYRAGYTAGRDGCWVPVPVAWRHAMAGDVLIDRRGRPWLIESIGRRPGGLLVAASRAADRPATGMMTSDRIVDPDEQATVLVPAAEVDARRVLKAGGIPTRIVERRTHPQ